MTILSVPIKTLEIAQFKQTRLPSIQNELDSKIEKVASEKILKDLTKEEIGLSKKASFKVFTFYSLPTAIGLASLLISQGSLLIGSLVIAGIALVATLVYQKVNQSKEKKADPSQLSSLKAKIESCIESIHAAKTLLVSAKNSSKDLDSLIKKLLEQEQHLQRLCKQCTDFTKNRSPFGLEFLLDPSITQAKALAERCQAHLPPAKTEEIPSSLQAERKSSGTGLSISTFLGRKG